MTNKNTTSSSEIKTLADFWQSPAGQLAIQHIEKLKDANLDRAMRVSDEISHAGEASFAFLNRARGIKVVLDDIQMIVNKGKELSEKEGELSESGTK